MAFEYHWTWSLPAPPEALWPLASDTNRFNRDVGLPPVREMTPEAGPPENARRHLRLKVKGVTLDWEELPFEWVRPWRFHSFEVDVRGIEERLRVWRVRFGDRAPAVIG